MHLLVPFAAALSDAGRRSLRELVLPQLAALLPVLPQTERDDGDAWSLSPPHERALARAWGWRGADGRLPFAAQAAADAGLDPGDLAWGRLTPVHLHLGTEQVSLLDPRALQLDDAESATFYDALAPLFTSEGFVMHRTGTLAWLVAHDSLRELATASLDRVIGRHIDRWLPAAPAARLLRRVQNEAQMLLHTHPLNDEREARELPRVSSLWASGCGVHQPARPAPGLVVDDRLRACALAEDWPAWAAAWRALDAQALPALRAAAQAGLEATLTLCGERSALTLRAGRRSAWRRWLGGVRRGNPVALLETL
jgi:hypothetical protein